MNSEGLKGENRKPLTINLERSFYRLMLISFFHRLIILINNLF